MNDLKALMQLDVTPCSGSNVLYTFHYYLPHPFTHQGVERQYSQYLRGLRWPPPAGSFAAVEAQSLAAVAADPAVHEADKAAAAASTSTTLKSYYAADYQTV